MLGLGLGISYRGGGGPRPALDLNFLGSVLDSRLAFTRASTATYFNSLGVLTSAATDAARFDYNPATLAARGLLLEEARTNTLLQSNTFATAPWSGTATVATGAVTAPDGTASLTLTDSSAVALQNRSQTITVVSGTTVYTGSIYLKAGTSSVASLRFTLTGATGVSGEVVVDLTNGLAQWRTSNVGTSFSITSVGNGWYRVTSTITDNNTGNTSLGFDLRPAFAATYSPTADVTAMGSVNAFGGQVEVGAFATSYIPSTTIAVARAVDVCSALVSAFAFNADEGALSVACTPVGVGAGLQTAVYLDDGTSNERMGVRASSATNAILAVDGGATQTSVSIGTLVAGTAFKAAFAYRLNDMAGVMSGGTVQLDTTCTLPTVTKLLIGTRLTGSESLTGWYTRAAYYNKRLSDATLIRIIT